MSANFDSKALQGRNIIVAVTGGIAAYKVGELVRLLIKQGANVQVIMTEGAKAFVQPLTFQALSGRPVRDSLLDPAAELGMGHIELARWADLFMIVPASADVIARMSAGMANDLLTTSVLATAAPVAIVPAMNQYMWANSITQANIKRLVDLLQVEVWGPDSGDQACGESGPGRMIEPAEICQRTLSKFSGETYLKGKKVVITAGPTRERIDPVRYISNDSSGKMGYALAESALRAGAEVQLVSGPVSVTASSGVKVTSVESCQDMRNAVHDCIAEGADIFIGAAAVADYRVAEIESQKMKKKDSCSLELVKNPDILASVAALESAPFCVGFAAETQDLLAYARQKLQKKKVQLIIANDVSRSDIGFNNDDNQVVLVSEKDQKAMEKMPKRLLAEVLMKEIFEAFSAHYSH